MNEPDYDEGEEEGPMEEDTEVAEADDNAEATRVGSREASEQGKHNLEDLDPGLAEWFRGGKGSSTSKSAPDEKSESEIEPESDNDSDNADMAEEEGDVAEDDWEMVKSGQRATESEDVQDVKMGETGEAMAYDEELIFKHLQVVSFLLFSSTDHVLDRCFYLDSPVNARRNGMEVKSKQEEDTTARYLCPN